MVSVYIETYGCAFNVADSEAMAGVLGKEGFRLADAAEGADVVVLNTCTVKDRTFFNFEKRFAALKAADREGRGPALVVAGCIPKANDGGALLDGTAAIGPDTIGRIGEAVRSALRRRPVQALDWTDDDEGADAGAAARGATAAREMLPTRRRNPAVEILPIASGCLSACTFCQTRLARGRLRSFRPSTILDRARRALDEGVSELWITSQDAGAYGHDCGETLAVLLRRLCALPGEFRVRLGMTSPIWVWRDLEAMLDALAQPKMFRFLHVPVQSGSDAVLRAMRRGNTAAQFEAIAAAFGGRFRDGSLVTDAIAGFPTESVTDFEATLELLRRTRPVAVNCSRFSARPGTAAAAMTALSGGIVRERSRRLFGLVRELAREYHARRVGRRERVLTCEQKPNGTTLAHNDAYRPVVLRGRLAVGRWLDVEYTGSADFHLRGEPVEKGGDEARSGSGERGFRLLSGVEGL